jgi:hypothetical protein
MKIEADPLLDAIEIGVDGRLSEAIDGDLYAEDESLASKAAPPHKLGEFGVLSGSRGREMGIIPFPSH